MVTKASAQPGCGEMVERVARAICASDGCDPDSLNGAVGVLWKLFIPEARAAIEAMREPTADQLVNMALAADEAGFQKLRFDIVEEWRRMIDAALAPPTEPVSPGTAPNTDPSPNTVAGAPGESGRG